MSQMRTRVPAEPGAEIRLYDAIVPSYCGYR
jgi:hypothetical protein